MTKIRNRKGEIAGEKLFLASQWQLILRRFLRHRFAVVSVVILAVLYLSAIFAEFISPYDPNHTDARYLHAPPSRILFVDKSGTFHLRPFIHRVESKLDMKTLRRAYTEDKTVTYPIHFFAEGDPYKLWGLIPINIHLFGVKDNVIFVLGADRLGRDMFSRILYGARISLSIGLVGIVISFVLGILIGGVSGYYGGRIDVIIQRTVETIRSIPTIPLWMALSVALPPYWSVVQVYFGIVIILSLVGWTGLARVIRGKFMSVKEEDFVVAARLTGANEGRIIIRHLLPSFYSYIIAALTLSIPEMIIAETALSFLGLGLRSPAISWGVLLKEAQQIRVLAYTPWLLIPAIFVVVTVLTFNFVGDGLRDAADPYGAI